MKHIKHLLLGLVTVLTLAAVAPVGAQAPGACDDPVLRTKPPCTELADPLRNNPLVGPTGTLTNVTRIVSYLVGVASIIAIIIGGFKYVVSGGDSSGIQSAKNTILYAVVGIAIAASAQAIIIFVLNKL